MKILFVTPYVPTLIRVRPYQLLHHLIAQGHQVTLATLSSGSDETAALAEWTELCYEVLAARLPRWLSWLNALTAVPRPIPLQSVYCWRPSFGRMLQQRAAAAEFDLAHVEHLRGVRYALALNQHLPVVWDSVDSISHLFAQAVDQSQNLFGRWITRFELGRTRRYEAWLPHQFQQTLVTSATDRQAFLDLVPPPAPAITVLANGVDSDYFRPDASVDREVATLVISGKMSYHANVTMVLHLVQQIMPLVWAQRANVRVQIVGKDPTREIQALAGPQVNVTGWVEDVRPYLQRATLAVAPIVYGAGIQNKVLEAMACGTPVVCTEKAVAAVAVRDQQELLLANDPASFAAAILYLLEHPERRQALAEAGRAYVENNHNWGKIVTNLVEIYQQLIP